MLHGQVNWSQVIPCSCRRERLAAARKAAILRECELPALASEMTFASFRLYPAVKTAFEVSQAMAQHPGELAWLALIGNNGTGKTHLAISICRAWMNAGIPAKYTLVSLLLDELKNGFNKEKELSYEARFKHYCNIPLLLLDDYGMEASTPWVQEKLDTIVDYRLMHNLSLLVTSNKALDEMPARIRSRLMRHPKSQIIAITAEDYVSKTKLSNRASR